LIIFYTYIYTFNIPKPYFVKNIFCKLLPSVLIVLCTSCASTYKSILPQHLDYPVIEKESGFSYKYNVLKEAGNRKLAKKEDKARIRIVAIKLVNHTDRTLKYGSNFRILSGSREVTLLPPTAVTAAVKQTVPTYLLYLLLTPMRFNVETEKHSSSTPVGLILGPALAGGNIAIAATANKRFNAELFNNSIMDREIKAGETFYGLIGIQDNGFIPLSLEMIK
jgi:hypothetical protein